MDSFSEASGGILNSCFFVFLGEGEVILVPSLIK